MKDKKSFVLRIDTEMYEALEKWASDEFRSVNGQIEWLIAKQLKETNRWKSKISKKDTDQQEQKKSKN
ncbi:MAG: Arc family DNA binding domain-containing protein [Pseudopedobacter saltans]|uniref:Arc family DNA binding domain-containing protein n=1 Tax=Pseudopedobacter saltans TaxID=151895 RepID=A0A2W5F8G3_9SPHI|nr:MAG: Arc family DNA binding domain-containing protein [Pseudopedobacter saltans]